jgi:hypothetical protein
MTHDTHQEDNGGFMTENGPITPEQFETTLRGIYDATHPEGHEISTGSEDKPNIQSKSPTHQTEDWERGEVFDELLDGYHDEYHFGSKDCPCNELKAKHDIFIRTQLEQAKVEEREHIKKHLIECLEVTESRTPDNDLEREYLAGRRDAIADFLNNWPSSAIKEEV